MRAALWRAAGQPAASPAARPSSRPSTFVAETAAGHDYLDAAREMADTGRPTLARLLAEEAAERTAD
ncbi:hypothetical protein AB0I62_32940, partial [Streptomyces sp. NPDC050395]